MYLQLQMISFNYISYLNKPGRLVENRKVIKRMECHEVHVTI